VTSRDPANRIKSVGPPPLKRLRASLYKTPGRDPAFAYHASSIPGTWCSVL
jgi:hypothetical protein